MPGPMHDDPYAELGDLHIQRRFPLVQFTWIIGGLVVAGFIGLVVLNSYLKSGYSDLPNLGYAYFVAFAGLAGTVFYAPTLWAFLFGPHPFIIGQNGFRFGGRQIAFKEIAGLRHDAGRASTRVLLNDGSNVRLRWPIWRDSEAWVALLEHRSHPYLMARARADIRAGKRVSFGRKLALDGKSLHVGRQSMPMTSVTDFHFVEGRDNGDDYRKLKIRTVAKEYTIDERKIVNPEVFADLFQELVS